MNPEFSNLTSVLVWLTGAGSAYIAGWVISLLAENWAAWHNLPRNVKFLIPLVLSPVLAMVATVLLRQDAFLQVVGPWFTIAVNSIIAYLGTQQAYMSAKRSDYGKLPEAS